MDERSLSALADPAFQQHFLISSDKLRLLFDAAAIRPDDQVLELGAGAGTIARNVPPCKSLTVVELDRRLIGALSANAPHARVVQGDALQLVREIPFDVLIGSLPNYVTDLLVDLLADIPFRTAVLAVGEFADLDRLRPTFQVSEVTAITGPDFAPPQPSVSRIVKVTRVVS